MLFIADASSSNEAVHLQQRLRSLSTELVTLRNRLHVQGSPTTPSAPPKANSGAITSPTINSHQQLGPNTTTTTASVHPQPHQNNTNNQSTIAQPIVPPRSSIGPISSATISLGNSNIPNPGTTIPLANSGGGPGNISIAATNCAALPGAHGAGGNISIANHGNNDSRQQNVHCHMQQNQTQNANCGNLEDLIHLQGPLTEDAVMKCLQARFAQSNFYVSIYI